MSFNLDGQALVYGHPIMGAGQDGAEPMTWKDIALKCLRPIQGHQRPLTRQQKEDIALAARIVERGGDINFRDETIELIMDCVGETCTNADIVLQLRELIDPKAAAAIEERAKKL